MKNNLNNEDNDSSIAFNIMTNSIDYYKILGLSHSASIEQIKEIGKRKINNFHPDRFSNYISKLPDEEKESEQKRLNYQFKLIYDAYKILKDPNTKEIYDKQFQITSKKDYKQSFKEFIELQNMINLQSEENTKKAKKKFENECIKINEKHRISSEKFKDKIKYDELKKRLEDSKLERESQYIETMPKKIFNDDKFDNKEFNKKWNKTKHKRKTINDKSIIKWEGIAAANDNGIEGNQFVSVDDESTTPYTTANVDTNLYSTIDIDNDNDDDTSNNTDEDSDQNQEDEENTKYNNKIDISKRFEDFKNERTKDLTSKTNKSNKDLIMDNPFNISSQLKKVVGDDVKQIKFKKGPIDTEYVKAYKQLVYNKQHSKLSNEDEIEDDDINKRFEKSSLNKQHNNLNNDDDDDDINKRFEKSLVEHYKR